MKVIKFNKSLLKKDWTDILNHFGLIDHSLNRAYPSCLYMSKEDIKTVRNNCRKKLRKELGGFITKRELEYSEGMNFLNLGANSSLEDAIKPGYALVEDKHD